MPFFYFAFTYNVQEFARFFSVILNTLCKHILPEKFPKFLHIFFYFSCLFQVSSKVFPTIWEPEEEIITRPTNLVDLLDTCHMPKPEEYKNKAPVDVLYIYICPCFCKIKDKLCNGKNSKKYIKYVVKLYRSQIKEAVIKITFYIYSFNYLIQ